MKTLIIEDELPAAKQLQKLLHKLDPSVSVIDVIDSVESSVKWLQTFPSPEVIFMDIQIADGLSFDIFNHVKIECPVVFTTAFDQYAIKAFRVNAIDYLLKPIEEEELAATWERVKERVNGTTAPNWSEAADFFKQFYPKTNATDYKDRFLIKVGNNFITIETPNIAYFFSEDGMTHCQTLLNKKHFIENTLDELEQSLNPKEFFRINRKIILNIKSIQKISPHFNGRLKLELTPQYREEVFVARERVSDFKTWLGG